MNKHFYIITVVVGCVYYSSKDIGQTGVMVNTALLIVSNVTKALSYLNKVSKHVNNTLYIGIKSHNELLRVNNYIANIYSKSTAVCHHLDVRLLLRPVTDTNRITTRRPIELVLYDNAHKVNNEIMIEYAQQHFDNLESNFKTVLLDECDEEPSMNVTEEYIKKYEYVALGGTFDRLHNGHKILISEAIVRCSKMLTVGVTDINMIQSKKLWELIEPVEMRISKLLDYLNDVNPDIQYNVLPINDVYGPTKDDPRYQLLVLSEETRRGGEMINAKRKELGLKTLDVHTISLADDVLMSNEEEHKISSSNRRMRMLGKILRKPEPNSKIPKTPYVIGLSGGIASGKTRITERLQMLGAAVVNCDILGHELYKPGLPLNVTLTRTFGSGILMSNGEIDRKVLGQIVFNDKSQLEKLNSIMWPAILTEAKNRINELGKQGYKVVVMEAAILLQAKWHEHCHQVWAVIIPPEEAIKRLMARNNLTEAEARIRIEAQPSNMEQVSIANVVFSPYWSYEYTNRQLDRAWNELQPYLN